METSDFVITSTITYRPYRVPPRCRKARPVPETFTHEFHIPSVTADAAPVVALVPDDRSFYGGPPNEDAPLRAYGGQLYAATARGRKPVVAGSDAFPATHEHESWRSWDAEAIEEAGQDFDGLLIVDGQVWKPVTEPAYAIVTLGMGGNHGGTYLEIDYFGRYSRRFPLTDYDAAVEAAAVFAEKRGDTRTIPIIRQTPKATVLDPSAFTIPTQAEALEAAHAEIRSLADQARDILSGTLTREKLDTVEKLAEKASDVFWHHDIDEHPAS